MADTRFALPLICFAVQGSRRGIPFALFQPKRFTTCFMNIMANAETENGRAL